MRRTPPSRTRIAGSLLLACTVTGLAAAPAQAQEYRYWSFWDSNNGSWTYASAGPSSLRPDDGAVEGFRFTVSADSAAANTPRSSARFDAICHATPAKDGTKRIGVVIDFGTAKDAPAGETPPKSRSECARVPEDATAGDALAAVAEPLRYDPSALLCAIAGYPKSGCADQVGGSDGAKSPGPTAKASPGTGSAAEQGDDGGGGPSAGLLGGLAAVIVLGAAAVWQARRRRG